MNKTSAVLLAFAILILGNLFATFVDVIVKAMAADVSVYQYLFLRQLAVMVMLLPLWLRLPSTRRQLTNAKVFTFRALMTNIGAPSAVIALLYLPLATANVIFYAAPMITLILAALVFKEVLTRQRVIVTVLGFAGVAIALRPEYLGVAGLLAFCTAIAIAAYNLSVKWLTPGASTINTIFYSNLFAVPLIALIAAFNWQPITQELLILSVGSCIFLVAYQGCCIIAFQKADAGAIAVAEYSGLIFAALLGWLIFNELLDALTLLGISLIILPILWQSWNEHHHERSRQQIALSVEQTAVHADFTTHATLESDVSAMNTTPKNDSSGNH